MYLLILINYVVAPLMLQLTSFADAGVSLVPKGKEFTEDGHEYQYQVNFLSSFLLTHLLEKHLAADARLVFTSSLGSYFAFLSDHFAVQGTRFKVRIMDHSLRCQPASLFSSRVVLLSIPRF